MTQLSPAPTAKVLFRVPDDERGADVETLWAYELGDDLYQLANTPFFAYGVSWEDVVSAPYDPDEEFPTFREVVSKSGNRTVRILFDIPVEEGNESSMVLLGLEERGCSCEGLDKTFIAVNIPPDIPLGDIALYLNDCDVEWEYADPTEEDLFEDQ